MPQLLAFWLLLFPVCAAPLQLSLASYQDRVHAAWLGQIIGALMGFQFEHKVSAAAWVDRIPARFTSAPVDDDYYYEMVAVRAFEKYGPGLTVVQLGEQWKANNAGAWGSSEQTRLLLTQGLQPPDTGHPRFNRLWFSIGPQFSADVYGLLAPGMPNLAAALAREFGHINGYAEGTDGAVFVATMVSLAFVETDPRTIVKKAAQALHPDSPYRQAIDLVIRLGEAGRTVDDVAQAVEDRWHIEYPATNNAVANGGLVAVSVWFGEGDFLKTVNLAFRAGDFTDTDCNAANAGAVVGALRGTAALPPALVAHLQDRIQGTAMGGVPVVPPVDESISDLARRTAAVGATLTARHGATVSPTGLSIPVEPVRTQPLERFTLSDLTRYWNPEWTLERAGFGGAGGGMRGIRGNTYLDGDVLATYPRDEVRGVVLSRSLTPGSAARLKLDVAADPGRVWQFDVYAADDLLLTRLIEGQPTRTFETLEINVAPYAGKSTRLRLFQRVLVPDRQTGNAYWRNLRLE